MAAPALWRLFYARTHTGSGAVYHKIAPPPPPPPHTGTMRGVAVVAGVGRLRFSAPDNKRSPPPRQNSSVAFIFDSSWNRRREYTHTHVHGVGGGEEGKLKNHTCPWKFHDNRRCQFFSATVLRRSVGAQSKRVANNKIRTRWNPTPSAVFESKIRFYFIIGIIIHRVQM